MFSAARNRRTLFLAVVYAAILAAGFHLAYEIRFDFVVPGPHQADRLRLLPLVIGVKLVALIAVRQFGSMMTYFSIPDLLRVIWGMSFASLIIFLPRAVGL